MGGAAAGMFVTLRSAALLRVWLDDFIEYHFFNIIENLLQIKDANTF